MLHKKVSASIVVALLLGLMVLSLTPARATTVGDVRDFCGFGGVTATGCQLMISANFPKPGSGSYAGKWQTYAGNNLVNPPAGAYESQMCFYSHGTLPNVITSSGSWSVKQYQQCQEIAVAVWTRWTQGTVQAINKASDANSFNGAMAACTKGRSIGVNPSSWLPASWGWFSCVLKVAFIPVNIGSVIADKPATATHPLVPGLRTQFLSRIPFAYVVTGAKVMGGFVSQIKDHAQACVVGSSSSGGISTWHVPLPNTTFIADMKLPCTPPVALGSLRTYEVDIIWLITGLGLWTIAAQAVKRT